MDAEAESNTDRWMRFSYLPRLTAVRQRIAALIGAKTEECVMVTNASYGISTVLRNIEWQKGDIIVACETDQTHFSQYLTRLSQSIQRTAPSPAQRGIYQTRLRTQACPR
jgi:selenocysteine lyase/cysteine desulfurase